VKFELVRVAGVQLPTSRADHRSEDPPNGTGAQLFNGIIAEHVAQQLTDGWTRAADISYNPQAVHEGMVARMPEPPAVLLECLAYSRRCGNSFDEAWPICLPLALEDVRGVARVNWRAALSGTRDAWEAGYCGWPGTRRMRAPVALVDEDEREPIAA
jgi:hypothetical protein